MVKTKLVAELINDGAKLLLELDRQAFPVESMFWILLPNQDYWRLVIGSRIASDEVGRRPYRRLDELFQEIEFAGITMMDISLFDPESSEFQSLFSLVTASSRLAAGATWLEYAEAVVYRWTDSAVHGELSCDVSLAELNQIWQDERKPLKLPALLIALERRRLTLRFHPRNGPLSDISNIKPNFDSALQKARPDCKINWL